MRFAIVSLIAVLAVPALAANGNGQGGLKGAVGQSEAASPLGLGSVPMNAGGPSRVAGTNPGNGNTVFLPSNAVANGFGGRPIGSEVGDTDAGVAAAAGGAGGGIPSVGGTGSGGGGGNGGLAVTEEIFAAAMMDESLLDGGEAEPAAATDTIAPVPVPATLSLLALGLLAFPLAARRRRD